MYSSDGKAEFLTAITPVFSLNIFVETMKYISSGFFGE